MFKPRLTQYSSKSLVLLHSILGTSYILFEIFWSMRRWGLVDWNVKMWQESVRIKIGFPNLFNFQPGSFAVKLRFTRGCQAFAVLNVLIGVIDKQVNETCMRPYGFAMSKTLCIPLISWSFVWSLELTLESLFCLSFAAWVAAKESKMPWAMCGLIGAMCHRCCFAKKRIRSKVCLLGVVSLKVIRVWVFPIWRSRMYNFQKRHGAMIICQAGWCWDFLRPLLDCMTLTLYCTGCVAQIIGLAKRAATTASWLHLPISKNGCVVICVRAWHFKQIHLEVLLFHGPVIKDETSTLGERQDLQHIL